MLKTHLQNIIESRSETILKEVIPQKEYSYKEFNPHALVGMVPKKNPGQKTYLSEKTNPIYHSPQFPRKFGYDELYYFAPYFSGHGIDFYFEIESYEVKKTS